MTEHDSSQLGAYALGSLEPDEAQAVDEHLAGCAECREELAGFEEMKEFLGEVPPEAFLDGPPDDGDLLLQRTLRQVRAETAAESAVETPAPGGPAGPRRWLLAAAAVVVIAGAALGGGVLIGRQSGEQVATPPVASTPPAGAKTAITTDATTGTTMAATVSPRTGWSWIDVELSGLKAGAECELRVTGKDGKSYLAGSWRVSERAAQNGSRFSGGVVIPISEVNSVEIVTVQGQRVVATKV